MNWKAIWEFLGAVSGVGGSLLLAINSPVSKWGFVAFLISNLCWIKYGYIVRAPFLITMQLAFFWTSVIGIINWFSS